MLENERSEQINLNGPWQFRPGEDAKWQEIRVPASWESQGIPFSFEGPAVYRREVFLPAEWAGRKIVLTFGAVSYACAFSVNGIAVGENQGMWTPFSVDITSTARAGESNLLELEVYKPSSSPEVSASRYPVRSSLAGFLPDLAGSFGGIWQPVQLAAHKAAIENLEVTADFQTRTLRVMAQAEIIQTAGVDLAWRVEISHQGKVISHETIPFQPGMPFRHEHTFHRIHPWSPEHPHTYTVRASLISEGNSGRPLALATRQTGFRRLSSQASQLLLNGKPFMVRGILAWGWDPNTIAPYTTLEQARAEIRRIKSLGFNCIKLCLYVPNPEFFQAADEEGILLWLEFPMWLPEMTSGLRKQAPLEYQAITTLTAHHPSVAIYSLGCEMNRSVDAALLEQLDQTVRTGTQGVLLCDNSGSGESYGGLDIDFADFTDYHPYYDIHFFEPLLNHWRRDWLPARPLIFGEFCDSDTFRDLEEIIQANGGEKPWWMTPLNPVTTWRSEAKALLDEPRRLAAAGMSGLAPDLVRISHDQAFTIRKYTLEAVRRRSGMGGYIITGLRDTPISTSGVFDDLGRTKWSPEQFLPINSADLLCLETDRRRTWRHGGDRPDPIDPFNLTCGGPARWQVILHCAEEYFPASSRMDWRLKTASGGLVASGFEEIDQSIQAGTPGRIGSIACRVPTTPRPQILTLSINLAGNGRTVHNEWPVWVYPLAEISRLTTRLYDPAGLLRAWGDDLTRLNEAAASPARERPGVLVTSTWDEFVRERFATGEKILLLQPGDAPFPTQRVPFWREAVKILSEHPLWQGFPHQGSTGMQFFAIAGEVAFDTARLAQLLPPGTEIRPILRRLDAREFTLADYIFEAQLGVGKLIACSLPLNGGAGSQPSGLRRNIAGAALLRACLACLRG